MPPTPTSFLHSLGHGTRRTNAGASVHDQRRNLHGLHRLCTLACRVNHAQHAAVEPPVHAAFGGVGRAVWRGTNTHIGQLPRPAPPIFGGRTPKPPMVRGRSCAGRPSRSAMGSDGCRNPSCCVAHAPPAFLHSLGHPAYTAAMPASACPACMTGGGNGTGCVISARWHAMSTPPTRRRPCCFRWDREGQFRVAPTHTHGLAAPIPPVLGGRAPKPHGARPELRRQAKS